MGSTSQRDAGPGRTTHQMGRPSGRRTLSGSTPHQPTWKARGNWKPSLVRAWFPLLDTQTGSYAFTASGENMPAIWVNVGQHKCGSRAASNAFCDRPPNLRVRIEVAGQMAAWAGRGSRLKLDGHDRRQTRQPYHHPIPCPVCSTFNTTWSAAPAGQSHLRSGRAAAICSVSQAGSVASRWGVRADSVPSDCPPLAE